MIKKGFGILILTIFSISVWAQRPKKPEGGFSLHGIVKGRVEEAGQKIPMEYTNVALYRKRDSVMVDGKITDKAGKFVFNEVKPGRYYMAVHFIGFNTKYIDNIMINKNHRTVDLGTIYLEAASATLSGVEIKGEQRHVQYKLDKKVINVTKDLTASGGSAVDVLENVPSVDVDLEGNITVRGSSNFTVYIDGKPSVLEGNDALQQIPSSAIQRIEIITNPSAKYDPDGVGGILNVIMKKNKKPGLNGVVNLSVSTRNKYRGDVQLSYRTGKINWYAGVDGNRREFNIFVNSEDRTWFDDTTYRFTDIEGSRTRKGYGFLGGFDYYLTEKSTLSISGKAGNYGFGMENLSKRRIYTIPYTSDEYSMSESHADRMGAYYQGNINFEHKFDDFGQKLDLMVNFNRKNGDDTEEQSDYVTDSLWNDIGLTPSKLMTIQNDNNTDWRIKADYSKPIGEKGMLEAGYQSRIYRQNGGYIYQDYDTVTGNWIDNDAMSNTIDFSRDIHGGYITYGNSIGNFGFQAGIRGEYTYRDVQNKDSAAQFTINRFDYFPSVHLSYLFKKDIQLYGSYSKRIRRPRERQLDPFPMVIDPYNTRVGNPELEPEYIDSYELGLQKTLKKSFVSLEGYYRINKNKITRIKDVQPDGTILHTYQNLNKDYTLGAELMVNAALAKWFNLNASINYYNYRLEGNIDGEDVAANSNNMSAKLNGSFRFKNNFRVQLSGIYRSPTVTAQGHRKGFAYTNLAVRKSFFNRKLSTTLTVRDVLRTARFESWSESDNFYSHSTFSHESPIVTFTLTWYINNYKKKKNRNNGEGMDMMDEGF